VAEQEEAPNELRHLTVVPVVAMDLATLRAQRPNRTQEVEHRPGY
jgi:hypothetical protein